MSRVLRRVAKLARHPGLVAVISDFRGDDSWVRPLAALRQRHSVLAVEVRDPREGPRPAAAHLPQGQRGAGGEVRRPPEGSLPVAGHLHLVDPETGELVEADTHSPIL